MGRKIKTNRWFFSLNIGFFAGLIWGGMKVLTYYLGFTKVWPAFLAKPYLKDSLLENWVGHLIGWGHFIVFSILAAVIYVFVLYRLKGPWPGLLYGAAWWLLLYLAIGPVSGMMKVLWKLDLNSIITDCCIFLLWGVFIGYTIAFEYTDERLREPMTNFD